jgi:ribosome-associated protein
MSFFIYIRIMEAESNIIDFKNEVLISATKSSGPGGQNVNKVNTKVELRLDINKSKLLSEDDKLVVFSKLKNKINSLGELIIVSQSERTQLKNRENAIAKLNLLIANALKIEKKRKTTKIPKSAIRKRLKCKKITSEKKLNRKTKED